MSMLKVEGGGRWQYEEVCCSFGVSVTHGVVCAWRVGEHGMFIEFIIRNESFGLGLRPCDGQTFLVLLGGHGQRVGETRVR